jgi:hypothetical protein
MERLGYLLAKHNGTESEYAKRALSGELGATAQIDMTPEDHMAFEIFLAYIGRGRAGGGSAGILEGRYGAEFAYDALAEFMAQKRRRKKGVGAPAPKRTAKDNGGPTKASNS